MKHSIAVFLLFLISMGLAIITFFFRDRFLFYLHGYDTSLLNSTAVEAFEAYKKIGNSKFFLILSTLVICGISAFVTKKYWSSEGSAYFRIFFYLEMMTFFVLIFILAIYFLFPKRLM